MVLLFVGQSAQFYDSSTFSRTINTLSLTNLSTVLQKLRLSTHSSSQTYQQSYFVQDQMFVQLKTAKIDKQEDRQEMQDYLFVELLGLTLSWWRPLSYRNQSIDLWSKSMDWFLYGNGLRHESVKNIDTYSSLNRKKNCTIKRFNTAK